MASLNAVFHGFGFGFGFLICLTAGFGLGFGFPEFCVWLPQFKRRFDKTFIHKLHFDFYLPAGALLPPFARRATYAFPAPVERLYSVAGKVFRPERIRLSDEFFSEALIDNRCNGGVV